MFCTLIVLQWIPLYMDILGLNPAIHIKQLALLFKKYKHS